MFTRSNGRDPNFFNLVSKSLRRKSKENNGGLLSGMMTRYRARKSDTNSHFKGQPFTLDDKKSVR